MLFIVQVFLFKYSQFSNIRKISSTMINMEIVLQSILQIGEMENRTSCLQYIFLSILCTYFII